MNRPHQLTLRVRGALLGAGLGTLAWTVSDALGLYWADASFGPVALAGVVSGLVVGFIDGSAAVATSRAVIFGLAAAVRAVIVGLTLMLVWWAVASERVSLELANLVWLLMLVPVAFVWAMPMTVPAALVAVWALRTERARPRLVRLVGASIVVAAFSFALVPDAWTDRSSFDARIAPSDQGDVRLEWSVANRSLEDRTIAVWSPNSDGSMTGWSQDLPACFISTGESFEHGAWFMDLADGAEGPWESLPQADLSAAEVPGALARVWVDIGQYGSLGFTPGRGWPPVEELTVDLCAGTSAR